MPNSKPKSNESPLQVRGDFALIQLIEKKSASIITPESVDSKTFALKIIGVGEKIENPENWIGKFVSLYHLERNYAPLKLTSPEGKDEWFMLVKFEDVAGAFNEGWDNHVLRVQQYQQQPGRSPIMRS
jgi:hypothetical protein